MNHRADGSRIPLVRECLTTKTSITMHANILYISSDKEHLCTYSEEEDNDYLRGAIAADYIDGPRPDEVATTIADLFKGAATYTEYNVQDDGILGELTFDDAKLEEWAKGKIDKFKELAAAIEVPTKETYEKAILTFDAALRNDITDLWTCEPICFDYGLDTPVRFALKYLAWHRGQKLYVCDCINYHC